MFIGSHWSLLRPKSLSGQAACSRLETTRCRKRTIRVTIPVSISLCALDPTPLIDALVSCLSSRFYCIFVPLCLYADSVHDVDGEDAATFVPGVPVACLRWVQRTRAHAQVTPAAAD